VQRDQALQFIGEMRAPVGRPRENALWPISSVCAGDPPGIIAVENALRLLTMRPRRFRRSHAV